MKCLRPLIFIICNEIIENQQKMYCKIYVLENIRSINCREFRELKKNRENKWMRKLLGLQYPFLEGMGFTFCEYWIN